MIYFDNSATSLTKPTEIISAVNATLKHFCANPSRSNHMLSITAGKAVSAARQSIASLIGVSLSGRIVFTASCTAALNQAILGFNDDNAHFVITAAEHNAVLRPLYHKKRMGKADFSVVQPAASAAEFVGNIEKAIRPNTKMIVVNAVSNVTGQIAPIGEIGRLCRRRGLIFLVDGAQAVGHIEVNCQRDNVDLFAFAPHKGLHALPGVGVLYVGERARLSPIIFGGTGSDSASPYQSDVLPDGFEAGTLNLPAIVAAGRAAKLFCLNKDERLSKISRLSKRLHQGLSYISSVQTYSTPSSVGIAAFRIAGRDCGEVAFILSEQYGICVRAGLHCAPLMHQYLKTNSDGLIRASLSYCNTEDEVDFFLSALRQITRNRA